MVNLFVTSKSPLTMKTVNWKVDGMTCSNCALTIQQYLQKQGMDEVKVNLMGGDVSFSINGDKSNSDIIKGIESLGYSVQTDDSSLPHDHDHDHGFSGTFFKGFLRNHKRR